MTMAIRFDKVGGPEVLVPQAVEATAPGAGEVWIEQEAIGLNFLDVMQRRGDVPVPLPSGIGLEAAGRVVDIGKDVQNCAIGDSVAYALGPIGAYASGRLYPAERLVPLPDTVSMADAAAILFKGLTAQYLLKSTYPVGPDTNMLLYGVAGGLGQVMVPWARHLGAFVIGVVSKPESVAQARALGCNAVLVWGGCDLPTEVAALTARRKADVVYDGVGRVTLEASLDCLRPRGMLVSIGASSGQPAAVPFATLNAKGSLFVTRAGLAAHISDVAEYRARAADVFAAFAAGIIRSTVWRTWLLADAAAAHKALESGESAGPMLLIP